MGALADLSDTEFRIADKYLKHAIANKRPGTGHLTVPSRDGQRVCSTFLDKEAGTAPLSFDMSCSQLFAAAKELVRDLSRDGDRVLSSIFANYGLSGSIRTPETAIMQVNNLVRLAGADKASTPSATVDEQHAALTC